MKTTTLIPLLLLNVGGAAFAAEQTDAVPAADAPAGISLEDRVAKLEQLLKKSEAEKKAAQDKLDAAKPAGQSVIEAEPSAPFAFADFSWIPGNAGAAERPLTWGPFTGELRVDTVYHQSFANPKDHTISGSSEVFRPASSRSRRSESAATSSTRTSWAG